MVANKQTNEPEISIVQSVGLPMKMVKIMGAVGNVAKGGTNSQQGYKFIQSDDVVDAIRAEMVKNNVAVFAKAIGYEMTEGTTKNGGVNYHAVVQFEFMLVDADSGESMACTWYGESIDTSDKSFSKAGTSALKYWLLKTFMIAAGEPDADTESPERSPRSALRGNGQQERRIPSKSNSTSPNSSAEPSPAINGQNSANGTENSELKWTCNSVTVKQDRNHKTYLVYNCNEGKATGRGRDDLRKAGYQCEDWTVIEETYFLSVPALVTVKKNGDFWNVLAVATSEVIF